MSKEVRLVIYDLDAKAFSPAANDVDGLQFTALYTLQHRLPRDAKS
jgi:hypothetical protein